MIVLLIGACVAGIVLGCTDSVLFRLPSALMALSIAAVLIVRTDIDVGLVALLCASYLIGVVMANTRLRSSWLKQR